MCSPEPPRAAQSSPEQPRAAQSSRLPTCGVSSGARPPGGLVVGQAQLSRVLQSQLYQDGRMEPAEGGPRQWRGCIAAATAGGGRPRYPDVLRAGQETQPRAHLVLCTQVPRQVFEGAQTAPFSRRPTPQLQTVLARCKEPDKRAAGFAGNQKARSAVRRRREDVWLSLGGCAVPCWVGRSVGACRYEWCSSTVGAEHLRTMSAEA